MSQAQAKTRSSKPIINAYYLENEGSSTLRAFCPIPLYSGYDANGTRFQDQWGITAAVLKAGELTLAYTDPNTSAAVRARVVQVDASNGANYSLCAWVAGPDGDYNLAPSPCSTAYGLITVETEIPPGAKVFGLKVNNVN